MAEERLVPKVKPIKFSGETLWIDTLLTTEYGDISQAGLELPSAIAWLEWKRAEMTEAVINAEAAWKEAESQAFFTYKEHGLEDAGFVGKPTEKAIQHAVCSNDLVLKATANYAAYKKSLALCSGMIRALEAKMELTRTSEATRRRIHEQEAPTCEEMENNGARKDQAE